MNRRYYFIIMFITLLSFSFQIPFTVSGATLDAQENSFAVSPIPFWNDYSSGISLNYDNNVVNINQTAQIYETTYLGYNSTIIYGTGAVTDIDTTYYSDDYKYSVVNAYAIVSYVADFYIKVNISSITDFHHFSVLTELRCHTASIINCSAEIYNFDTSSFDNFGAVITNIDTNYTFNSGSLDYIQNNIMYVGIRLESSASGKYAFMDYLEVKVYRSGISGSSNLDVEIPITSFKDIKIETMINIDNFNSLIYFGLSHNSIDSGLTILVNKTEEKIYLNNDYVSISDEKYIRLIFTIKYSINYYKLEIYDYENTLLDVLYAYSGILKINDILNIYSSSFVGSISMYYLSGDIQYLSEWLRNEDYDTNLEYTDYGFEVYSSSDDLAHDYNVSLFVSGFQFWRSEYLMDFDITNYDKASGDYFEIHLNNSFTFFYPNGTELYKVTTEFNKWASSTYEGYSTNIEVYKDGYLIWEDLLGYSHWESGGADTTQVFTGKFGIWKNQENYLSFKFNGDFKIDNTDQWSYWTSDEPLENYQCNISHAFEYNTYQVTTNYVQVSFTSCEYAYNSLSGVSEPHFSTTWWNGIPIIGAIINGFIWVGNMIVGGLSVAISAIISGTVALFTPLFNGLSSAISAVASSVWSLFSGAISGIASTLSGLASGIWSLFSSILGTISSGISSIVSGMTQWISDAISNTLIFVLEGGIQTLLQQIITVFIAIEVWITDQLGALFGISGLGTSIASFFVMFVTSIGNVLSGFALVLSYAVTAVSLVVTYASLFGPSAMIIIGIFVIMDIATALLDNEFHRFDKYFKFLQWTLDLSFKVVNAVIQFIGGIIP